MTIEITPQELHQLLQDGQAATGVQLVDVRRAEEVAIGTLPGAHHLLLQELPQRWQELDHTLPTVTLCHHGVRSMQAAQFLRQQGFTQVQSLAGGLDRWSQEVDPTLPRYRDCHEPYKAVFHPAADGFNDHGTNWHRMGTVSGRAITNGNSCPRSDAHLPCSAPRPNC
ncbi:MAG: hypothetical protein FJX22_01855 [Alphaproteobacteria bacterium]|nr:hypothetical protein [Alphaproteobacteria bacterium]